MPTKLNQLWFVVWDGGNFLCHDLKFHPWSWCCQHPGQVKVYTSVDLAVRESTKIVDTSVIDIWLKHIPHPVENIPN